MSQKNTNSSRRNFLLKSGLTTIPLLTSIPSFGFTNDIEQKVIEGERNSINFIFAGLYLSPNQYLEKLNQIHKENPIDGDVYGLGGVTQKLEEAFKKQTQKEAAIYLPSGTMANQLAIKLLNGANTKVIVPENSHIFRDEADAAQSVHNLRLVPLGKDKPYFTLDDLKRKIDSLNKDEVFRSGLGTIVIESPVRRANQVAVPLKVIEEISKYCKDNNYKLHLDGSRLHLAAAFTQVPIAEYSNYFDTVYISLYKCLNAAGGAILCGDNAIIDKVNHQIKILGGTLFSSWMNTSVALHYLTGIEERFGQVREKGMELIRQLNRIEEVTIQNIKDGSFVFNLEFSSKVNIDKLQQVLSEKYAIAIRSTGGNQIPFSINESILSRELNEVVSAWKSGMKEAIG